jgi:hypothetical protein
MGGWEIKILAQIQNCLRKFESASPTAQLHSASPKAQLHIAASQRSFTAQVQKRSFTSQLHSAASQRSFTAQLHSASPKAFIQIIDAFFVYDYLHSVNQSYVSLFRPIAVILIQLNHILDHMILFIPQVISSRTTLRLR